MDYGELGVAAFYALGPVALDAGADYAPRQAAIGGSNLYLSAGAAVGIPGTPLTVSMSVGRSTGDTVDPARAARLRPQNRYHDWRIGVEHVRGAVSLGLDYVGTDIDAPSLSRFADVRHAGDRLLARARVVF
jgi:hypothetical protein